MPVRSIAVLAAAVLSLPGGVPAQAAAPAITTVTVGNARFQVLSPTLIRTEYATSGRFTDAGTFNVVGRADFGSARSGRRPVRKKIADGWLTIDTGAVTLRYLIGSGPFTGDNLSVRLTAGPQRVDAAPWAGPSCAPGVLCEAETLRPAATATDHGGYTGTGFAAGFTGAGDALTFSTSVAAAGDHHLDLRYANAQGGDGQNTTRTLSVTVDDGAPQRITLAPTGSWDTWAVAATPITLGAGRHRIAVVRTAADSGNVNIDSLAIVRPGEAYPQPAPPAARPCAFDAICEAETGTLTGGAKRAADHNGYAGDGFLAGLERAGASGSYAITGIPRAGDYAVQLRYANAEAGSQPVQSRTITVNGTPVSLAPTSGWDYWRTVAVPVRLGAGTDTVTLGCPTDDSCHINVDTVAVAPAGAALKAPHAPLGGYRRGLDGVDGGALTQAGLLYQDGWSLLDDSASALWNPATRTVSARPAAEQDGYIFAYGRDFARALRELSTLTGPTALLPEWAYGVWYSEYYDRTAADFQQTIVPRFKSAGVPLDVLVVDTDFKSPDTWNGWAIDPAKFPDPRGFLDWAHGQGLHLSYNIHPSIRENDPKFAQAQAIAKGKIKNGVFDWGDPDQLAAYFWLHQDLPQDFTWLDWCCDNAGSSLPGVTPDSWINQQYAQRDGFAFSRGYGSLQSGGYGNPTAVPTGPWAEKRTTLHFTGDAISNWQTLRYEVGYTPGESAATGLAAISHDIGGHTGGLQEPGSEPGSTKLPDDLYARWVQFGTFQPIDRLHSNHSDRLPWQYGPEAAASATKFLQLRERLRPYTYAAAREANRTGMPLARALYLAYPDQPEAYAFAGSEYLFGPDFLVAPVTTPGATATTTVWFPPGATWTDYFTHRTYRGGTTAQITTTLATMPVFVRGPA
ncbi:TIM-barrel domain-containing protein [Actinoplanes teichomyceticus]|uniref:Carbohydrate-binding protein with CBM35 doain n=1 Tax=Actinoplanes teichomyceticus TaxID=1867 RepID=A0A561VI98_ACTTI|nr:TIM-barrel domain-containing protein [Actinoplanes teichomyceticus]TWG11343.1 carbohydrate-binding protein with CBM35 doain [Actinoplanes teichomyceticus]GIF16377.1 alpha-xylosidase [Actinoplanes teichomyceticus]